MTINRDAIPRCKFEGCTKVVHARGLCPKHYQQNRTTGFKATRFDANTFELDGDICKIGLRDNYGNIKHYGIVDADLYHEVIKHRWGYIEGYVKSARSNIYLHHLVLDGVTGGDHKDRNPLNCCRANLRICTESQNAANRSLSRNTSGMRGVYWNSSVNKWVVQIKVRQKPKYLGAFKCLLLAGIAYDVAALTAFGEFANTNILKNTNGSDL